jgi:dipeptidyl aminopeptidase/acylaminoacyl peptidase
MNMVSRGNQGVWTTSFDTGSTPRMFADLTTIVEKHSMFSPDGRWLAYMSNTTLANSNQEIFVQPFPLTAAKYQVTSTGGRTPLWSPDGRQLYFHEPSSNRLLVVDIRTAPSFTVGKPVQLSVQGTIHPIAQRNYDVTPDGKRLLVVLPAATGPTDAPRSSSQQINVVLNWVEELKARVPVTK